MDKAKARPWNKQGNISIGANGHQILMMAVATSHDEMEADRNLIVKAVNNHESMLHALREAKKILASFDVKANVIEQAINQASK